MSDSNVYICRFCLCMCDKGINILNKESLLAAIGDVFYKMNLEITPKNGLPIFVCTFCYNTISQFHSYYIAVAENQDKLGSELEELWEVEVKDENNEEIEEEWQVLEEENIPEGTLPDEIANYIEIHEDEDDSVNFSKNETNRHSVMRRNNKRALISDEWIRKYKQGAPLEPALKEKLAKNYNKLYICDFCDYYTLTKIKIARHLLACKDISRLPPKIRASYRTIPAKETLTISCPLCPPDALKMKNEQILELHLKEHADCDRVDKSRLERGLAPLIPCTQCERRLRTENELITHLNKHQNDEFMTCELCGRTTVKSNLRSHLRNHFKRIICEFCSKVFKNSSLLQKHIGAKHSGPEFFVCDRCNTKIRRERKFKEHLMICRGPNTVWPCIHCGETFESKSHRHYHVKKFHIGYKCKMCAIEVKSVTQLKHHYRSEEHKQRSQEKREEISRNKVTSKEKENGTVLKRR